MTSRLDSGWVQPGEVCLTCGRTTPAKIEQHHVAGHANDRGLTVGACRRDGSYCHEVLTEQQRARGVRLDHEERSEAERAAGVFGGLTDVLALAMRYARMDGEGDVMERLGDTGTQTIFQIDPPDITDRVVGPDPRLRDRRLAGGSPARTAAKRWSSPRVRKPPPRSKRDATDRIQARGVLDLEAGAARSMLGDTCRTQELEQLAARHEDVGRGFLLLVESGRSGEYFDAVQKLGRSLDLEPFDPRASEDEQGRVLVTNLVKAVRVNDVIQRFYVRLADAHTSGDAEAALDELIAEA